MSSKKGDDNEPLIANAAPPPVVGEAIQQPLNYVDVPSTLEHIPGVMVRQQLFLSEILFNWCERRNRYTVTAWDPQAVSAAPTDDEFLAMPKLFETREDSTCLCRYCCKNFRSMKLGIFPPFIRNEGEGTLFHAPGYPEDGTPPLMELERPFKCPILCCFPPWILFPQELHVKTADGSYLGHTRQDWRCFQAICCCAHYDKVYDKHDTVKYVSAWHPLCCSPGGFNNCCAPTCFNSVFTLPIFDAEETHVVAQLENVWPGCNCRGLLGQGFSNWVLKFPVDASGNDKALLLSTLFLQEFQHFERNGEQ